jgi:hypothetical protein
MLPPNCSLCHFIEHVEGEHRELLPMSAGEAVLPLRRPVLRRLLALPTRYRALVCRDGERWRCENPPRKIPYYRLRPVHFGH